jgi:D-beta-D-heptose 7-phosphate kinase/D-beta-D-heptose 1-phosphate adenosyltransferase
MILIVGDVMLDRYFWGVVTRISPEAPVPIVQVVEISHALGGAANVAANVIGLGRQAVVIGAVGKNKAAEDLKALMREYGITDYLIEERDRATTVKTRVIAGTQQLMRIDDEMIAPPHKRGLFEIRNNVDKVMPQCKAIIVSDYGKGMITYEVMEHLKQKDVPIFVDPKGVNWELYRGTYCITPNMREFIEYYNTAYRKPITSDIELRKAAQEVIAELSLDYIVITRGSDGMLVVPPEGGTIYHAEVQHIEDVIDVSGAGDTVVAALACKTAGGTKMSTAADFANRAAGIVVARLGTSPVRRGEVR